MENTQTGSLDLLPALFRFCYGSLPDTQPKWLRENGDRQSGLGKGSVNFTENDRLVSKYVTLASRHRLRQLVDEKGRQS